MTGPIILTMTRTFSRLRHQRSTVAVLAFFLSAAGIMFALGVDAQAANGLSIVASLSLAVGRALPFLAAFLCMDVWSEEVASGRIDMLLAVAVREQEYAVGKFLGVARALFVGLVLAFILPLLTLFAFCPHLLSALNFTSLAFGFLASMLQGLVWCALGLAIGTFTRVPSLVVLATVGLAFCLPRGLWAVALTWLPQVRSAGGDMPLDAQILDAVNGCWDLSPIVMGVVWIYLSLLVTTKRIAIRRYLGSSSRAIRASTVFVALLSLLCGCLTIVTFERVHFPFEIPIAGRATSVSVREAKALADLESGTLEITCFLSRKDPRFHEVAQRMRSLQEEGRSKGSLSVRVAYVDPIWDYGAAERLIHKGIHENALVFDYTGSDRALNHRSIVAPIDSGFGERTCAAALQRLCSGLQRSRIGWTYGHGESTFDDYGPRGMSDIARELRLNGYENERLDFLSATDALSDLALVIIAGARTDFARITLSRLDAYLKGGGRVLFLAESPVPEGLEHLLSVWGLQVRGFSGAAPTRTGTDVIVSDFMSHPASDGMAGARLVLDRPTSFEPSQMVDQQTLAGPVLAYTPLALSQGNVVAAALERGDQLGDDIAIRPTRLIAIGDSSFVINGPLQSRANGNRDFFLGCVNYLTGLEALGSEGTNLSAALQLSTCRGRLFVTVLSVVWPLVLSAFFLFLQNRRIRIR